MLVAPKVRRAGIRAADALGVELVQAELSGHDEESDNEHEQLDDTGRPPSQPVLAADTNQQVATTTDARTTVTHASAIGT